MAAGGPDVLGVEPYEPSLINPDLRERCKRLDFIKKSINLADYLGSPILNINSGKLQEGVLERAPYEYLLVGVQELLTHAGDVILVIEPIPNFFIGTSSKAFYFIDKVDSEHLLLNLDIGHVFCSEDDCYQRIEKAFPYARHIHIEDIRNDIHHHEIPGEGDIDFRKIIDIFKRAGYDHYISVELHHHDAMWERALQESREYLVKLF